MNGVGGGGGRHKFFKILLPGLFELSLSIPPKFTAGRATAGKGKLRDPTGRSWDVDLHRDGEHRVSFTGRGWLGFVSANGISAGQLLVFEHRGGLDFAVDLFDASGCLSDGACRNDDDGSREDDDEEAEQIIQQRTTETTGDKESGDCRRRPEATTGVKRRKRSPSPSSTANTGDDDDTLCRRIERPYQLRFLDLSKSFCERVGWTSSCDVELLVAGGGEQRRWPVSVKVSAKQSGMMCGGWTEFAQGNGVGLSDACAFLPLQGSHGRVLGVRVIRGSGTSTTRGSS
ncbi:putative B3 domain-containing protein Os04g0346900 [Panicum virgatum]|nr:putative B3 domain-containing protein Os04g0346900 [Panicum virgatum]